MLPVTKIDIAEKIRSGWKSVESVLSPDGGRESTVGRITGSALALHCCKVHSEVNRKMENSTPCTMVNPENFILRLGTCDYVDKVTYCTIFNVGRFSGGFCPNRWNITLLWLFSCPVLPCTVLFSFIRPARTARPISILYGSNDVVPPKDGPFGIRTMTDIFGGNVSPNPRPRKKGRE